MNLTRRTDYAFRMLMYLADRPDQVISVRELSENQLVPYAFARGIQRDLSAAGFIETRRGVTGGVTLKKDPSSIAILEIIEAMQGDISCSVCQNDKAWCIRMKDCKAHPVWKGADQVVYDYLEGRKLSDLIEG